jgi:hypothetical protein
VTPDAAERAAVRVGVVTGVLGGVLIAAPDRGAALIGLDDSRVARLLGLADLALVPGLLRGRPRWPWLGARVGLNVLIVSYAVASARGNRRALLAAAGLVAATASDLVALSALWRSER